MRWGRGGRETLVPRRGKAEEGLRFPGIDTGRVQCSRHERAHLPSQEASAPDVNADGSVRGRLCERAARTASTSRVSRSEWEGW